LTGYHSFLRVLQTIGTIDIIFFLSLVNFCRYLICATKTVRLASLVMTVFVHAKLRKYVNYIGGQLANS
jgi:hypothetical protein